MLLVGFLTWWYGPGWMLALERAQGRIAGLFDYFSIDLLLRTYFSPFRQISAGKVQGSLGVQFHAFLDRLVSRIIGAIVRTCMIVIGVVTIMLTCVIELLRLGVWFLLPLLPLFGALLAGIGWVPWSR